MELKQQRAEYGRRREISMQMDEHLQLRQRMWQMLNALHQIVDRGEAGSVAVRLAQRAIRESEHLERQVMVARERRNWQDDE